MDRIAKNPQTTTHHHRILRVRGEFNFELMKSDESNFFFLYSILLINYHNTHLSTEFLYVVARSSNNSPSNLLKKWKFNNF